MKFQGNLSVVLDKVAMIELKGVERRCAETHQPFENDDRLLLVIPAIFHDDTLELMETMYPVLIENKIDPKQGSPVADFIARYLGSLSVDKPVPEQPSVLPPKDETLVEKPLGVLPE